MRSESWGASKPMHTDMGSKTVGDIAGRTHTKKGLMCRRCWLWDAPLITAYGVLYFLAPLQV